jgi:hypothetical protein
MMLAADKSLQAEHEQATTALPFFRSFFVLFAGIGILAFLISAISPQDDAVQQESFCRQALSRIHNEITAGISVPEITTNGSYGAAFIVQHPAQPDAVTGALFVTAACVSTGHHGSECSGRAPPRST